MQKKDFDALSIIAMRKAQYYEKIRGKVLSNFPPDANRADIGRRLRFAVSKLNNELFISEIEKSKNTIDPDIPIETLNLDNAEIVKRLIAMMNEQE